MVIERERREGERERRERGRERGRGGRERGRERERQTEGGETVRATERPSDRGSGPFSNLTRLPSPTPTRYSGAHPCNHSLT